MSHHHRRAFSAQASRDPQANARSRCCDEAHLRKQCRASQCAPRGASARCAQDGRRPGRAPPRAELGVRGVVHVVPVSCVPACPLPRFLPAPYLAREPRRHRNASSDSPGKSCNANVSTFKKHCNLRPTNNSTASGFAPAGEAGEDAGRAGGGLGLGTGRFAATMAEKMNYQSFPLPDREWEVRTAAAPSRRRAGAPRPARSRASHTAPDGSAPGCCRRRLNVRAAASVPIEHLLPARCCTAPSLGCR